MISFMSKKHQNYSKNYADLAKQFQKLLSLTQILCVTGILVRATKLSSVQCQTDWHTLATAEV